jgi:hypothetical protein
LKDLKDPRAGVGNLRPAGRIWPAKHFYQARNEFIIQSASLIVIKVDVITGSLEKIVKILIK